MTTTSESLFLQSNDVVFADLLTIVGHSESEITDILPIFRQQFLMTYIFALTTFLQPEKVEEFLEKAKAGDLQFLGEFTQGVAEENLVGSYLYAFEEVYGAYAQNVVPSFSEEQQKMLQERVKVLGKAGT